MEHPGRKPAHGRGIARSLPLAAALFLLTAFVLAACAGQEGAGQDAGPGQNAAAASAGATERPAPAGEAGEAQQPPGVPASRGEEARVVRVVDGDTIEVDLGGRVATVRYIGVDTPETSHPTVGRECFGQEAAAQNAALVAGRTVRLERDVSETDRYGRLLRYVWLGDTLVNEALVREGYAVVATYPPDVRYVDRFLAAEGEARAAGRGLWGACGGADTPAGQQPPPQAAQPPAAGACDPAYPDVCIPPPPPDLDCSEMPYRNIRVLPPDPHRLDGNRDGVGCEG